MPLIETCLVACGELIKLKGPGEENLRDALDKHLEKVERPGGDVMTRRMHGWIRARGVFTCVVSGQRDALSELCW